MPVVERMIQTTKAHRFIENDFTINPNASKIVSGYFRKATCSFQQVSRLIIDYQ
jgi:hypothetical protein